MDRTRYGELAAELKNKYAKGQNDYPTDLATAFALVNMYETLKNEQIQHASTVNHKEKHYPRIEHSTPHTITKTEDGYTFAQNTIRKTPIAGTDGRLFERTLCYNCQAYGHYAGNCNETNTKGTTLVYHSVVMTQTDDRKYSNGFCWTPNQLCRSSIIESILQTSERVRRPCVP